MRSVWIGLAIGAAMNAITAVRDYRDIRAAVWSAVVTACVIALLPKAGAK